MRLWVDLSEENQIMALSVRSCFAKIIVMIHVAGFILIGCTQGSRNSLPLGTYEWDPVDSLPNAVWSGTLEIYKSCIYINVSRQLDEPQNQEWYETPVDEPLRSFIRFPAALTRFNAITGELWVGGQGPMRNGDEVTIIGSEGWQQHWTSDDQTFAWSRILGRSEGPPRTVEPCIANASFYAIYMQPADVTTNSMLNLSRSHRLAGLRPWDTTVVSPDYGMDVILVLEPPCVFGIPLPNTSELGTRVDRVAISLPRPPIRLSADNNLLWYADREPMTTGDLVSVGAGTTLSSVWELELREAGCSADKLLSSNWITPLR